MTLALLLSLAATPRQLAHLARLLRADDALERGSLAADERVSPFATAGQARWREHLDAETLRPDSSASGLALAWRFFAERSRQVPPEARIFLARPNDALYMFGSFLWFPARLEVAPPPHPPLAKGADLARASARRSCGERAWLRAHGYAGCVEAGPRELRFISLDGTPP